MHKGLLFGCLVTRAIESLRNVRVSINIGGPVVGFPVMYKGSSGRPITCFYCHLVRNSSLSYCNKAIRN